MGFLRVAAGVFETAVANTDKNADNIISMIRQAEEKDVALIVFPELAVTGYTCADLFAQKILLRKSLEALDAIRESTRGLSCAAITGLPIAHEDQLFNAACVIFDGRILGVSVKTYIPNYNEYYEKRWFSSARDLFTDEINLFGQSVPIGNDIVYNNVCFDGMVFSVEICEDLWAPIPPSTFQAMGGSLVVLNPSASNELVGKSEYRKELVRSHSGRTMTGYVYASSGIGESSTDTVYGGHAMISEYGVLLAESQRFYEGQEMTIADIDLQRLRHDRRINRSFMEYDPKKKMRTISYEGSVKSSKEIMREYEAHPFVPASTDALNKRCSEIFNIQTCGLYKRMKHIEAKKAVIGISGGLDSTLALLVTQKAFAKLGLPAENIIAVTMPGFGTSGETSRNAAALIKKVGAARMDIPISAACKNHFRDIGHDGKTHDVVFENVQARERTMLLMNIANKENGIVVGTGDLSEIALGWATYNGDHMSMYSVNCGVPKTLVKFLIDWVAKNEEDREVSRILEKIIATPISPELLPTDEEGNITQKTEDVIGPYELHDFFLYHMMRFGSGPRKIQILAQKAFGADYTESEIKKWLMIFYRRFFQNQYKRSCTPDGPKVGTVALSPRADLRMPSDAEAAIWLSELEDV